MIYNIPGVWFNGKHSYRDYGMFLSERPDLGSPQPKMVAVDVPGANGVLDYTEAATGAVKYENRQCVFTFAKQLDATLQQQFMSQLRTALHGQTVEVELDEDAGWVYTGRATVEFEENEDWKLKIVITVDAYPYAFSKDWKAISLPLPDAQDAEGWMTVFVPENDFLSRNTYFRFTKSQRQSINLGGSSMSSLHLSWDKDNIPYETGTVYVKDTDDKVLSWTVQTSSGSADISFRAISPLILDVHHIAKITVERIPHCHASMSDPSTNGRSAIVNVDKASVIPTIHQVSTAGIEITVNNVTLEVTSSYLTSGDIVLLPGENVVAVRYINASAESGQTDNMIELIFREVKL